MLKSARHHIPAVLAVIALCTATVAADSSWQEAHNLEVDEIRSGEMTFERRVLRRNGSPDVIYYITPQERPVPIVLYIQGSGCEPTFIEVQPGDYASTVFSFTTMARRDDVTLMIVEKPYAATWVTDHRGTMTSCSGAFRDYFSASAWAQHLFAALNDARGLDWVDASAGLVVGFSEGAMVASLLAAEDPAITHAALVGSTGSTQVLDLLAAAYMESDTEAELDAALGRSEDVFDTIMASPQATDFLVMGHTPLRWSSFFARPVDENLLQSQASVYLLSGTEDRSVPVLSTEYLYSRLLLDSGRCVEYRRVFGAGHSLFRDGATVEEVEADILHIGEWFTQSLDAPC